MARASTVSVGRVAAQVAPCPPPALVVPLAPRLRSVTAVAEEEWQRLCCWPTRRQMASALRCRRPLAPPRRLPHESVVFQASYSRKSVHATDYWSAIQYIEYQSKNKRVQIL